jgi:hypothetical protein
MADWRIIGDQNPDDEFFIPFVGTPRSREILQRLIDGPTPEEREQSRLRQEARDREEAFAYQQILERHAELVATATPPIVVALLKAHAPDQGCCRACPSETDEYGNEYFQVAPCQVWKMIEANS